MFANLMSESLDLKRSPADGFYLRGGLPVEIAIHDLDGPVFAEIELPDALGERYLPVAEHEDLNVFRSVPSVLEFPDGVGNLELVIIGPVPGHSDIVES